MTTSTKPPGKLEKPARPPQPTLDELRALGFIVLPPSGAGYVMPTGRPPKKPKP